ncbi:hypothetical protein [Streptomyces sp. AC1-42T]|uniref:hypothetical protein n=1 Tax=Streptomyces sp. AC1-42T TaxID=2218665 RepID=UPI000DAF1696|nr:hypothetical protein [Streptomyces sp. AC1-42T]PZT71441.1 hypothetical protein DNK55_32525 [Streptomyces sp. AC1-42T]
MKTKTCTRCRCTRDIGSFYRRCASPGGYRPECKDCSRDGAHTRHRVDEMAVERTVAGDPPKRLTPAEKRAAVQRLAGRLTPGQIAERTGLSYDRVQYYLHTDQPQHPKAGRVAELAVERVPTKVIARQLGMSPVTVRALRREMGLEPQTPPMLKGSAA